MALMSSGICDFGWPAIDFDLPGVDGKNYTLENCRGEKGLVIVFGCNHCPFVKAILARLLRDARDLQPLGVNTVMINVNDATQYPEDSFDNMQSLAQEQRFPFPYLWDETQQIGRQYNAVCTPDFFGFNAQLQLQYRGRLDASGREEAPADARRELFEAMQQVALTGQGPQDQIASMGCSIKWKQG